MVRRGKNRLVNAAKAHRRAVGIGNYVPVFRGSGVRKPRRQFSREILEMVASTIPADGGFIGQLRSHGKPIVIEGLWGIAFPPATSTA